MKTKNAKKMKIENMSYWQKWLKPIIGILLILAFLTPIVIWELLENKSNGEMVAGMTVAGTFLGYVLSRSRFGFNGPIKKLTQTGDGRQMKALIILFMITTIVAGVGMVVFGSGVGGVFSYPLGMPIGVGLIIGGIIFGIGMVLATGCASGTLSDVGDGMAPAVVVLIFFMVGSALGVNFYSSTEDIKWITTGTSLSQITGSISIGVLINLVLLAFVFGGVVILQKWRASRKTLILTPLEEEQLIQDNSIKIKEINFFKGFFTVAMWKELYKEWFTYRMWAKLFATRWTWMVGVVLITIWYITIMFAMKETPGITGAYAKWGIVIFHGFGSKDALNWGPMHDGQFAMMGDTQAWQDLGIIVGALVAKLFSNSFTVTDWKNQKWFNWVLYAIGGLLMGLGARLARGCNFGALFTGVTFQTGFGWVFGIFLFAGAAGAALVTKKIRHETPGWVYKNKK